MTLTNLITEINDNLRGTDDVAPQLGDEDWLYWTRVANRKKDELYDDTKKKWNAAWLPAVKIGTITTGYNTFNLTGTNADGVDLSTLIAPGKRAYIIRTDGSYQYIDVIKSQEARTYLKQVTVSGINPKVLTFSWNILTGDQNIGGTLYLPGYYRPADMDNANGNSYVPVPDPHWLAMATAAEIAFNDITYDDKFDDLNGKANVLYAQMAHKNKRIIPAEAQPTPYSVNRIRGYN